MIDTEAIRAPWAIPAPTTDAELAHLSDYIAEREAEIDRLKVYLEQRVAPIKAAIVAEEAKIADAREQAHIYLTQCGLQKVSLPDVGTWYITARTRVEITDPEAAEREAIARGLVKTSADLVALKKEAKDTGEVIPGVEISAVESIAFRRK